MVMQTAEEHVVVALMGCPQNKRVQALDKQHVAIAVGFHHMHIYRSSTLICLVSVNRVLHRGWALVGRI
jgi:hypothetical protein